MKHLAHDILLGVAVADALGVPVEFQSRSYLKNKPVTSMIGYGTYSQAPGTWSDDSSMTLCLAECLLHGCDLTLIATSFIRWKYQAYWTPYNNVFDIGNTTAQAIDWLRELIQKKEFAQLALLGNNEDEYTNGNGSLMRILPLLLYIKGKPTKEQFRITWQVSALTHYHIRSAIACLIYLKFAEFVLQGNKKEEAYRLMQDQIKKFFETENIEKAEQKHFDRILKADISKLSEKEIRSKGYVIDSLEATFWCVLNNQTYSETALAAVNLGDDTDTTGAIAGGLAGIIYGYETIPEIWLKQLARKNDIVQLAQRLEKKYT